MTDPEGYERMMRERDGWTDDPETELDEIIDPADSRAIDARIRSVFDALDSEGKRHMEAMETIVQAAEAHARGSHTDETQFVVADLIPLETFQIRKFRRSLCELYGRRNQS